MKLHLEPPMRGRGTAEAPSLPGCTPQLVGVSHWSSTPTKLRTLNHRVRPRHGHASAKRRERWGGVSRRLQVVPLHQTLCHRSSEPPEGSAQPGGGGGASEATRPTMLPPTCHHQHALPSNVYHKLRCFRHPRTRPSHPLFTTCHAACADAPPPHSATRYHYR
jgi:hypothetical protein